MIKFSELWKEEDTRIEFWLSTNKTFQLKGVSPELVASFFEVRVSSDNSYNCCHGSSCIIVVMTAAVLLLS